MSARADLHVENYAARKSEHFEESLGVEAPYFYFWFKTAGGIPCSCSANHTNLSKSYSTSGKAKSNKAANKEFDWKVTSDFEREKRIANSRQATIKEKLTSKDEYDNEIVDIDDLTTDNYDDPNDELNLFNEENISCPICFGSGFIDSWSLNGGKRFVFDTSNVYGFDPVGVIIQEDENPIVMKSVGKNSYVNWKFRLPRVWHKILRLNVYNDIRAVPVHQYSWTWADAANNLSGTMTEESLENLQNLDSNILVTLKFLEDGVEWTHAELVVAYREAFKAQIPEIQQGYQYEALDWDISTSVELPPHLKIEEGSYLTESKYGKVWKVNSIVRKKTNGNNILGITADIRGLHPFEKKMSQLALFSNDYTAFTLSNNLEKG